MAVNEVCSEITSSDKGEAFFKCQALIGDWAPWYGPFFTGVFSGMAILFVIIVVAGER